MDYSKMTKQDLVFKLKEQKHLAEAVQAKDKEIVSLQKTIKSLEKQIKEELVSKDRFDAVNKVLLESVPKAKLDDAQSRLKEFEGSIKKERLDELLIKVEEDRKQALEAAVLYKNSYEDLLRVFKVNLDMAITTSDLLSEKVKNYKRT